jgi:DNA mismatch repair protein MSH6
VNKSKLPNNWTKTGGTKVAESVISNNTGLDLIHFFFIDQKPLCGGQLAETGSPTQTFKFRIFDEFNTDRALWLSAIRVFAELDCLFSLAKSSVAIGEPSRRPEFVESDLARLDFTELRHPTLFA